MRRTSLVVVIVASFLTAFARPVAAEPALPGQQWRTGGDQPGEGYGWAISALADVTGDGANDAIVSAPHEGAGLRIC